MPDRSCSTCAFAVQPPINPSMNIAEKTYECRRMPPQAQMIGGPNGQIMTMAVFPPTKADNWCGEYSRPSVIEVGS